MKKKEPKKIREITLAMPAIAANQVTASGCGFDMKLCFYQSVQGVEAGKEFVSFLRCVSHVSMHPATAKALLSLLEKTIEHHEAHFGEIRSVRVPIQLEERIRKGTAGRYEEKGE